MVPFISISNRNQKRKGQARGRSNECQGVGPDVSRKTLMKENWAMTDIWVETCGCIVEVKKVGYARDWKKSNPTNSLKFALLLKNS